jgi:hypothetical protein
LASWHYRIAGYEPGRHIRGDSIKRWLNGVAAADLKDSVTPSGFIGLQVHGVKDKQEPLDVRFRNLRIKELRSN